MSRVQNIVASVSLLCTSAIAQIQVGDLLVDVYGGQINNEVSQLRVYRPNGTHVLTTTGGSGDYFRGVAVAKSGRLVTTRRLANGFNLFDPTTGLQVETHDITDPTGDIDVFADGTLAIARSTGGIMLRTESGSMVTTWNPPGMSFTYGIDIDAHDELWCTVVPQFGVSNSSIVHFSRTGTVLGQFSVAFSAGDLVVAPDGTIWCMDSINGVVMHLASTGTVLSSFLAYTPAPYHVASAPGIARGADGTLYVGGSYMTAILRFDPAGNSLGQIPLAAIAGSPYWLDIVEPWPATTGAYCTSSTSTSGCTATIASSAQPSASSANPCTLSVTGVEGQRNGLLFYGIENSGFAPLPWSAGSTSFLCVKPPTQRTPVQTSGGTSGACDGAYLLDWNLFQQANATALGNPWSAGDAVYLQAWFRDPPAPKATNLSNAYYMLYVP